ncbi:MAG: histidinol-phosphate transaminase [Clostridiales bacterium]|jgi:histidinol-phosphate aminotransferase|nr:histidinol-phosphate transaminase [Clostridiales bacterium]
MDGLNSLIREGLKSFEAYKVVERPYSIKIDANESPFSLSDSIKNKIINYIRDEDFNRYPDTDSYKLRKAIAGFYNKKTENIICGVGSDELIDIITKVFLNEGDKAAIIEPTFSMYALAARINHGSVITISSGGGFAFQPDVVIETVNKEKAKLLFLCTPNNPTGSVLEINDMVKIIENTNCVVVIDEAYGEFGGHSMIEYIEKYNNIIVLKTFSKAFGIAGLRVGYGLASKEMIGALNLCKPPYNLSSLSQFIATLVLQEVGENKNKTGAILRNKEFFCGELRKYKFIKVFDSGANFVLMDSEKELFNTLTQHGILVKLMRFNNYANYKERLRVTIGTRKDMETVLSVIEGL